ncbi:MAG: ORF6N domain-containing protein [Selenomonadaceae bacterium]|nr:ORF6N domain-containing protein [Selenomonadaceae bacterium]
MVNISILPPVKGGKEDFRQVERIAINDEVVLTTKELAEFYGTNDEIIMQNFRRNQEYFKEGKHFFKLEGDDLKDFKTTLQPEGQFIGKDKHARIVYLWTRKGFIRHCKILTTDKAWKVFEKMEDTFFKLSKDELEKIKKEISKEIHRLDLNREFLKRERENLVNTQLRVMEIKEERNMEKAETLKNLATVTNNEELRDELIKTAANLILGKDS